MENSWWFGPALTLPGQEGRRRRKNRKEKRGERDLLAENGGSPHPEEEESPPFLVRRMPFCPGRGLICHPGNPLSSEPLKNTAFSKKYSFLSFRRTPDRVRGRRRNPVISKAYKHPGLRFSPEGRLFTRPSLFRKIKKSLQFGPWNPLALVEHLSSKN
jgi:hypothetical protein